jgi:hypothetical protein
MGDPHLRLPHGGVADFKGENNAFFGLLSAPGFSFAMLITFTSFLLPKPLLVHGSFWTKASWVVRGDSGQQYAFVADANAVGFDVIDPLLGTTLARRRGVWQEYAYDGILGRVKQSTGYVRARGGDVNVTRKPIYNHIEGPSTWRFDMAMRPLDGTGFEGKFGPTSSSCLPHGIIGQAYDGDSIGISGKVDNYTPVNNFHVITTSAQAEGAIEGSHSDYKLKSAVSTNFKYSRFERAFDDKCAARDMSKLRGTRVSYASSGKNEQAVASTTEQMDTGTDIKAPRDVKALTGLHGESDGGMAGATMQGDTM